ncbi:MAG: hypothetical protein V4541_09530 [Bacteroidota bacterium]
MELSLNQTLPIVSYWQSLKIKLANYGALRPEAWAKILNNLKVIQIKTDETFNREPGSMVYIVSGLLKEYDARSRKKPAIVNFISSESYLYTNRYNEKQYLKACRPTFLIALDFEQLMSLYLEFEELKSIYDALCEMYDESICFRQILLEEKLAEVRIKLFICRYQKQLQYLRRKDMANYLLLDYFHFTRLYSKLL